MEPDFRADAGQPKGDLSALLRPVLKLMQVIALTGELGEAETEPVAAAQNVYRRRCGRRAAVERLRVQRTVRPITW